jgi:hypothetical protein
MNIEDSDALFAQWIRRHPQPRKKDRLERVTTWLIISVWVAIGVWLFVAPYYEMRSFNHFSKTTATYLDAVFTELRVIPDKEDKP